MDKHCRRFPSSEPPPPPPPLQPPVGTRNPRVLGSSGPTPEEPLRWGGAHGDVLVVQVIGRVLFSSYGGCEGSFWAVFPPFFGLLLTELSPR